MRPGPFFEMFLFALRAGCLTDNVFKGHAARLFLPSGQVFASRRVTFFLRAQKKVTKKKRRPAGLLASLPTPSGASLNLFASGGAGVVQR